MALRDLLIRWTPNPLVRLFARPYIAGNSLDAALQTADQLWHERHIHTTLDLLGEGIQQIDDVHHEVDEYLRMIDAIAKRTHVTLSLKPTQMGLSFDPDLCKQNIARLLERAKPHQIAITIDMEESAHVDATLQIYRALRTQFDNVGTVLQSRLFRTEQDIAKLRDIHAHIRLCIGIYPEPPERAYQQKSQMKDNFFHLLPKLLDDGHFVAIATHDESLLKRCLQYIQTHQIPPHRFEVQMLLGVPRQRIQQEIQQAGITVRLYVPYATDWKHAYAYCKRRMIENPSIAFYVLGNLWHRIRR